MKKSKIRKKHLAILFVQLIGFAGFLYFGLQGARDEPLPNMAIYSWILLGVATIPALFLRCENCGKTTVGAISEVENRSPLWLFTKAGRKAAFFTFKKYCPYCGMERD